MAELTSKELSALQDQLGYEQILVKKYRTMAEQCSDVKVKKRLSQLCRQASAAL